jgi:hypothetical protein
MKIYSIKQLEVNPSGIGYLWGVYLPGVRPGLLEGDTAGVIP